VARLRSRGWPPGLSAASVLVSFLALLAVAGWLLGAAVGEQASDLGPTVTEAVDDVETWLVEDAPFDVDRADIKTFRADTRDAISNTFRTSGGTIVSGVVVAVELFVSLILGLIVTFFVLKDGERFARWAHGLLPDHRQELAERLANRSWRTLGGYLRGAAFLGTVEGIVMGVTLAIVGAELALPVAVFTFVMAFIPFVGAILAGILAVLVALATAGGPEALIVLVVAVVVQQLDNDLLAPVVYGKALELHPVLVLLSIAGGGALFGIAGSLLAVPVTAVVVNAVAEARTPPDGAAEARAADP
jgi:predicted PurR-regulated permease PerM